MKLIHVDGTRIINLEHVISAKLIQEHDETRDVYSSIDGKEHPTKFHIPVSVELVTVGIIDSGYHASESMSIKVNGQSALELWEYMENHCDVPMLERELVEA